MLQFVRDFISKHFSLELAHLYKIVFRYGLTVRSLDLKDLDSASQFLAENFAKREPLCRHLDIAVVDLLPFFKDQIRWSLSQNLAIGAWNRQGEIVGLMICEDHCAPYIPNPSLLNDATQAIGQLLDELKLPARYEPKGVRELCYVNLVAMNGKKVGGRLMNVLMAHLALHGEALGYQRFYAKVTNPSIPRRIKQYQRIIRRDIFEFIAEKTEKDFAPNAFSPLKSFEVTMISWPTKFVAI